MTLALWVSWIWFFIMLYCLGGALTVFTKGHARLFWPLQWIPEKAPSPSPTDIAIGLVEQALTDYPEKWVKQPPPRAPTLRNTVYKFEHKNIEVTASLLMDWSYDARIGGYVVNVNVKKYFEQMLRNNETKARYKREHGVLDAIEEYLK